MSDLTTRAIKASFRKLLRERSLTRISVREIAQDCGINRNTFYYHYHDIPELMEEILKDEVDRLIAAYPDISSPEECVETIFDFVLENRREIYHIYNSVKRDVFDQYLMEVCDYTITSWYDSVYSDAAGAEKEGSCDRTIVLRFLRYEIFGACIDFMNNGMPAEAVDEAKHLFYLSLELLKERNQQNGLKKI